MTHPPPAHQGALKRRATDAVLVAGYTLVLVTAPVIILGTMLAMLP